MAAFTSAGGYSELRPAYTGEAEHTVAVTIPGSGSIAGQTFDCALLDSAGSSAGDCSVAITDAGNRVATATLFAPTTAGEYFWSVRRTDDSSELVVAHGVLEVSKPGGAV